MEFKKGTLVGGIGALVTAVLFFVAPWVYAGLGPLTLGFATGFDIATAGRVQAASLLFAIPIAGIVALLLALAEWKEMLATRMASAGILIAGAICAGVLLYTLPQLSVGIGGIISFTQMGWGIWAEIVASLLVLVGGVLNLVIE